MYLVFFLLGKLHSQKNKVNQGMLMVTSLEFRFPIYRKPVLKVLRHYLEVLNSWPNNYDACIVTLSVYDWLLYWGIINASMLSLRARSYLPTKRHTLLLLKMAGTELCILQSLPNLVDCSCVSSTIHTLPSAAAICVSNCTIKNHLDQNPA